MKSAVLFGLVASVAGVVFFALGLLYVGTLLPLDSRTRVLELDRAGVFNDAALQAYSPALGGQNLRQKLGPWIAERAGRAVTWLSAVGIALSAINAMLLTFALRKMRTHTVQTEHGRLPADS